MYTEDITLILTHCGDEVRALRDEVQQGSANPIRVKNTLENLRSVLDYAASDLAKRIAMRTGKAIPSRIYFPYGERQNHFKLRVKENLPFLKETFPKVFEALEAVQPFKCGDRWLVDLCELTNEVKHNHLTKTETLRWPTVRQPGIFVSGPGLIMRNNISDTGRLDDAFADKNGNVQFSNGNRQTWVTVENKILFCGKKIEVALFLERCTFNVVQLTAHIGEALK